MVNHSIQIYGRLRNQENRSKLVIYEIEKKDKKFDDLVFYNIGQHGRASHSFRFHKVFDQKSNQEDLFDNVAKPVVNSVLQGFNGTIFAYGQTGSGKTYSITGSPKNYNDRGLIPRSIQYVFAQNEKVTIKPTIYISYMEIYNEIGYDLLSSRHDNTARSLEELPRIVLLEDSKGETHMRNLSVLPVTTEQEAMRLLFLGDTNRTIAETPMNEYSSRSHCIFTIYVTFREESSSILRYSKLHLVDLAGSERVYKSLTTGTALREAKHINLSLHYLQQVILALSESNRFHIPYRNSMMTYILKDSLSGNCLTAMLATLSISKDNIQETISTCRFAQRVSLISTAPIINEIRDPQKEITFLRSKVEELERQVAQLANFSTSKDLSKNQEEQYKREIEQYLTSPIDELKVNPNMAHIQFCFKLLKSKITQSSDPKELELVYSKNEEMMSGLRSTISKQDEEISKLKTIIDGMPVNSVSPKNITFKKNNLTTLERDPVIANKNILVNYLTETRDQFSKNKDQYTKNLSQFELYTTKSEQEFEKQLFDIFLRDPKNSKDLEYFTNSLQKKLETAKIYADTIEQCQKNITYIRQQLYSKSNNSMKNKLVKELEEQQKIYSKSLDAMKTVKSETYHLQSGLKKAEIKTMRSFKNWLENQEEKVQSLTNARSMKEACCTDSDNFFRCNSDQKRDRYTRDCCCGPEIERDVLLSCDFTKFQLENSRRHCWGGNLCLGPICELIADDQKQHYHQPSFCTDSIPRSNIKLRNIETKPRDRQSLLACSQGDKNVNNGVTWNSYPCIFKNKTDQIHYRNGVYCGHQRQEICLNEKKEIINISDAYDSKSCKHNSKPFSSTIESCKCSFSPNFEASSKLQICTKEICSTDDLIDCKCMSDQRTKSTEWYRCPFAASTVSINQNTEIDHCLYMDGVDDDDDGGANHKREEFKCCNPAKCHSCLFQTAPDITNDPASDVSHHEDTDKEGVTKCDKEEEEEHSDLMQESDSDEFKEFMKTVPLTGVTDIDQEIVSFYRNKFCS